MHNLYINEKIYYYKDVVIEPNNIINKIENSEPEWEFCDTKPSNSEPYKRSSYEFADFKPIDILIFGNSLKSCIDHYEQSNNLKIDKLGPAIVNKCYPGKHMGSHTDSLKNINSPSLTIMVNLNDDYEGGEMVFEGQNLTLKPSSGSILIYPSREPYYHVPELITKGRKICCTIFGYTHEDN